MAMTQRKLGMDTVRVEKDKLLETLRQNRETHVTDFNEAVVGYRVELEKSINDTFFKLEELKKTDDDGLLTFSSRLNLVIPETHEEDYDVAIEMLEWSTDEHVDLSQHDFKCFVRDEWSWKEQFAMTSARYKG